MCRSVILVVRYVTIKVHQLKRKTMTYNLVDAIIEFHRETPGLPENFLAIESERYGLKAEDSSLAWRRVKYLLAVRNGQSSPYQRNPGREQRPLSLVVRASLE